MQVAFYLFLCVIETTLHKMKFYSRNLEFSKQEFIFTKHCILNVWQGSEYAFAAGLVTHDEQTTVT